MAVPPHLFMPNVEGTLRSNVLEFQGESLQYADFEKEIVITRLPSERRVRAAWYWTQTSLTIWLEKVEPKTAYRVSVLGNVAVYTTSESPTHTPPKEGCAFLPARIWERAYWRRR